MFYPVFAFSFPVKAFSLCVSVVPDSLGGVLCISRATCQVPGRDQHSPHVRESWKTQAGMPQNQWRVQ